MSPKLNQAEDDHHEIEAIETIFKVGFASETNHVDNHFNCEQYCEYDVPPVLEFAKPGFLLIHFRGHKSRVCEDQPNNEVCHEFRIDDHFHLCLEVQPARAALDAGLVSFFIINFRLGCCFLESLLFLLAY